MFNMLDCPGRCRLPHIKPWPFWSTYTPGPPAFLSKNGSGQDSGSRFRIADACVAWKAPDGSYPWTDDFVPEEVYCVKNLTWDRAVGAFFKLSTAQRAVLRANSEPPPDGLGKRYGLNQMALLVRP